MAIGRGVQWGQVMLLLLLLLLGIISNPVSRRISWPALLLATADACEWFNVCAPAVAADQGCYCRACYCHIVQ